MPAEPDVVAERTAAESRESSLPDRRRIHRRTVRVPGNVHDLRESAQNRIKRRVARPEIARQIMASSNGRKDRVVLNDKDRFPRRLFRGRLQFLFEPLDRVSVVDLLAGFHRDRNELETVHRDTLIRGHSKRFFPQRFASAVKFMVPHAHDPAGFRFQILVHDFAERQDLLRQSVIRNVAGDDQRVKIRVRLMRGIAVHEL